MPQTGFKSITISEEMYDRFFEVFSKNNFNLAKQGITSFSGYCTNILQEQMKNDKQKSKFAIEILIIEDSRIILKDHRVNRIIEVVLDEKRVIKCVTCNSYKCSHIGYCCSIDKIYPFKLKEEIE